MEWGKIVDAVRGHPSSLAWVAPLWGADVAAHAALTTLLLLDDSPHPTATLVVLADGAEPSAPAIQAALASHIEPALASWRADPQWCERAVAARGREPLIIEGVAAALGALTDRPVALRDAVAIALRDGPRWCVGICLKALGAVGWRALGGEQRAALLQQAPPEDVGWVWSAIDEASRAAAVQRAAAVPEDAARLIVNAGGAWRDAEPATRRVLIDVVERNLRWVADVAPAWTNLMDDERARLATAVTDCGAARLAVDVLDRIGRAGRAMLTVEQRSALDALALEAYPWRVLAMRVADGGWDALTEEERGYLLAYVEERWSCIPFLLHIIGMARWDALPPNDRRRLAAAVAPRPAPFFRCPPALWFDLAGHALPPATKITKEIVAHWRAKDAAADLGRLPLSYQALVLALAPWRREDAAKDSARSTRLLAAWGALPEDERVALALAHPRVLATVAAAARRRGGASAAAAAVAETVARLASVTDGADAKRVVGAMLRTPDRWRPWMIAFAPIADDPPKVQEEWLASARGGFVPDLALCARLSAKEQERATAQRAQPAQGRLRADRIA